MSFSPQSLAEFIANVKKVAKFDVDFDYCSEHESKMVNHSPSTEGVNLFDINSAKKFL